MRTVVFWGDTVQSGIEGSEKHVASIFRSLQLVINDSEECAALPLQLPEGGFQRNVKVNQSHYRPEVPRAFQEV